MAKKPATREAQKEPQKETGKADETPKTEETTKAGTPPKTTERKKRTPKKGNPISVTVSEVTELNKEMLSGLIGDIVAHDGKTILFDAATSMSLRNVGKLARDIGETISIEINTTGDMKRLENGLNFRLTRNGWQDVGIKEYALLDMNALPDCCVNCVNFRDTSLRGKLCAVNGRGEPAESTQMEDISEFGHCVFHSRKADS